MSTGLLLIIVGLWIAGHAIWSDWPTQIVSKIAP